MHVEAMTFNNVLANLGIAKQTNECDKVIQIKNGTECVWSKNRQFARWCHLTTSTRILHFFFL